MDQIPIFLTLNDKNVYFIYYYIVLPVLAGILILCIIRIRHMMHDFHRNRNGLCQFFTCHGRERWGPPLKVKEWQRNAIRHLIAQRETLDNDMWQMENRRNNLAEMEREEQKKVTELGLLALQSKMSADSVKSQFIDFELNRNKAKIEELRNRIRQKDTVIRSMDHARRHVTECLVSYGRGENPRLPVLGYIRGLFFDLL